MELKQSLKAILDLYLNSSYMEQNEILTNQHG